MTVTGRRGPILELAGGDLHNQFRGVGKVLAKTISYRLIHAPRIQARGGKIVGIGYKAALVLGLPDSFV